jgi:adenylate cyclase
LTPPASAIETKALADASPSIAVLPFGNLSPEPDNEFFADGLTEEVLADLSVIRALRVISLTSAMHFKGTNKDLRATARELQVRCVLEGSVRRSGTSLRVTAQLIDAENDAHVRAEKYSGQHRGRVRDSGGDLAEDRQRAAAAADGRRSARHRRAAD